MSRVSSIAVSEEKKSANISGHGMDRVVARKTSPMKLIAYIGAAAGLGVLVWWVAGLLTSGRSLSVQTQRVIVSDVTLGTFEDFIPLRGRLVPRSTVYLDAIEGGRVESVLVEDGALVEAGQPIAELSNTNLQLEVLSRDASVTEQLNNMRTIELQLEQNRLAHKRNLVEIEYQMVRLSRSIERQRELVSNKMVSQSTIDDLQDELTYFKNRRELTLESQATDMRLQEQQLVQLREAGESLQASLGFARKNLEDLKVRAPVAGKLSGFNIEVGQSIARGGRMGQIDDPGSFKVNARIDEFYLGRVDLGQVADAQRQGNDYGLAVSKIYPQVNNGQFEVDLTFDQEPEDLRRGQTLQLSLTLGDKSEALLIPNGSFYQETGGSWIFVVSPDETEAVRRTVRLGRRNTDVIEVLDGLEVGERVVTSPYTSYADMDRLTLN